MFNINAFAYPGQFTPGTLGAGTTRGRWSMSNQWSISKGWEMERYKFSVRLDANNIPVRFTNTTPDTAVNLSSPATFGKFGLSSGASYSTMDQGNGQLIISGRFEF